MKYTATVCHHRHSVMQREEFLYPDFSIGFRWILACPECPASRSGLNRDLELFPYVILEKQKQPPAWAEATE